MTGMDSKHCEIVQKSLSGQRAVDEKTFESLTVLEERLGRLKELGGGFADVEFSSAARKLARQRSRVVVC